MPQCLDFLRLARKGNPDVLPAEVILAELYLRDNQVAPARDVLEQAAAAEPGCPQTYVLLARLALAEGRATEAEALFEKTQTVAGSPGYPEAAQKRFKAEARAGAGDHRRAARRLARRSRPPGRLERTEPQDGQVRWRLARARFHVGKRESVHEELQQALEG